MTPRIIGARSQSEHAVPLLYEGRAFLRVLIPDVGIEQLELREADASRHRRSIGSHRSVIKIGIRLIPGLATFRHRPIDEQLGGLRMWSFVHGPNDERRRYESIAWGDEFNLSASALEQDIGWVLRS